VRLTVPASSRRLVEAAGAEQGRVLVNVEDIEAEQGPGLAYAVYLTVPGDPDRESRHIGNVSFFGIRLMNDPDRAHDGPPGSPTPSTRPMWSGRSRSRISGTRRR
jgi:hypothetical protein